MRQRNLEDENIKGKYYQPRERERKKCGQYPEEVKEGSEGRLRKERKEGKGGWIS